MRANLLILAYDPIKYIITVLGILLSTVIAYYLHSTDRDASMQSLLVRQNGGRRSWDVRFFYDFNNWEFIFYYAYQKKLGVRFGGLVSPSFKISYLLREGGDQVRWRFQMSFFSHGRHLGLKAPQT